MSIGAFIVGAILGGLAAWLVLRERVYAHRRAADEASATFRSLSAEALQHNTDSFLRLAETQLQPIASTLKTFDEKTQALDQERQRAYGSLTQQVRSLAEGQERLRAETGNLRTALRAPHVRGRWGEIQLKRVVELAGMLEHCDFREQASTRDADGSLLVPDLVVSLPGGKHVVVDAKAPLSAYLDSLEAEDEPARRSHLAAHARQVRDHIGKLAAKRYWQQFEPAPEFVLMFLPDETFFRAACEADAGLLELGPESGVLPTSPTTLIGLLKVFAYAWQQETVAEDARDVAALGRELYERLGVFASHFAKVGRALGTAVGAYNDATGSLERRLLVTARKFEQHGASSGELGEVAPLEHSPVPLTAAELTRAELSPPAADAA
ncbi:MAG TPA: DNA recombination protein RmuC [Gaiellaceae bacterium]|jgi:DNA recombination protein RmuC